MAAYICAAVLCMFLVGISCNEQLEELGQQFVSSSTTGSPWPAPQIQKSTPETVTVDAESFSFNVGPVSGRCDDILEAAFVRYYKLIFGERSNKLRFRPMAKFDGALQTLEITLKTPCTLGIVPDLQSDESYELQVSDSKASLQANEVWGVLRGLETFSQLIYQDTDGKFQVNVTQISDFPRFHHRGLLLDSSRHYVSMRVLLDNLDAMAQNKLNVFHWHIVDDPSFPYESYTFPEMSRKGAYNAKNHVYTQAHIKELIEYARLRGIRVIPEFDSPGHTQSWGKAITDLLTKCYKNGKPNGAFGPVDPSVNTTYTFLQSFFSEIASVFPDKYVHLGGDELSFSCWKSNPAITAFMKKMNISDNYPMLEEFYMQNLLDIVSRLNKGYIIWQEVVDNGAKVASDTVVQVWKGNYMSELNNVTKLGYKTLLSSCWYLDYIAYGTKWTNYYLCDPQDFNGTTAQKELVIGGEACLWGEYVDDTNLLSRLWPRASAVAERLWSSQTQADLKMAAPRINEQRCRMIKRGIPAEPANGPSFCPTEFP